MKWISGHHRTASVLRQWGGQHDVMVASHYFWHNGTHTQKSQQGLFQALLYHVMRSAPQLVDRICSTHQISQAWDMSELKAMIQALGEETNLDMKFCFFVDGLDEYSGAEEDIIEAIHCLALSDNIKVCVSSRPWPAFRAEWGSSIQTLLVQEFTRDDMNKYIREVLEGDQRFRLLASNDLRYYDLVAQVSQRASGVWLWVHLVVRDLLRDMRDQEPYSQLLSRLNSIPKDLKAYFEDIIQRIDPIHQSVSAQIFLLVSAAVSPLSILALKNLETWHSVDLVLKMDVSPAPDDEIEDAFREWQPRLQNRCRDLLKISKSTDGTETSILKYRVDFLHRTVRDFLRENHQEELRARAPAEFDPHVTLSRMMLVFVKKMQVRRFRDKLGLLVALVDEMLLYAWSVEQDLADRFTTIRQTELLDDLDRTMSSHGRNERRHWSNARDSPKDDYQEPWFEAGMSTFTALAIQAHLHLYVEHCMLRDPSLVKKKAGRPLLDYALRPKRVTPVVLPYNLRIDIPWLDTTLIQTLVERGADPNKEVYIYDRHRQGLTPWILFLMSCQKHWNDWSHAVKGYAYVSVKILLQHGANASAKIPREMQTGTVGKFHEPVTVHDERLAMEVLRSLFGTITELQDVVMEVSQAKSRPGLRGLLPFWVRERAAKIAF